MDWTFSAQNQNPIDSSPTTWPNLDGVYVIDNGGVIYKVDPRSGMLDARWVASGGPINSGIFPGGQGVVGSPASASSVSVSTCGGEYPACNMLFVAGNPGSNTGIVAAYNSATGNPTPVWSNASLTYAATSSPVVSDSEGLVYVQSGPNYDPLHGGTWTGQLIYA